MVIVAIFRKGIPARNFDAGSVTTLSQPWEPVVGPRDFLASLKRVSVSCLSLRVCQYLGIDDRSYCVYSSTSNNADWRGHTTTHHNGLGTLVERARVDVGAISARLL